MGKRKLHNVTYFQCDWTGIPMRASNCYMPGWATNGKLVKHGSYSNWESVIAHAMATKVDDEDYHKVIEHIDGVVGTKVYPAPSYMACEWFKPNDGDMGMSPWEFHSECCKVREPFEAIQIPSATNTPAQIMCDATDVERRFTRYMKYPPSPEDGCMTPMPVKPSFFIATRKKGVPKDREVLVYYFPFSNGLPLNEYASQLFRMQIYGDVVISLSAREVSIYPRTRHVGYTVENFSAHYNTEKRRKTVTKVVNQENALSATDFIQEKAQMQEMFSAVEARVSSSAEAPGDLAKSSNLPPPTGKELADLVDPEKLRRLELRMTQKAPPLAGESVAVA